MGSTIGFFKIATLSSVRQTQREALEEVTRLKSRICEVEGQLDRNKERKHTEDHLQVVGLFKTIIIYSFFSII